MNTSTDSITVNSCQYTPVYLIENPGVSEPRSYIITQNDQIVQRPVSDNLKKFYENSGKLEDNLLGSVESSPRPRIIKKPEVNVIGNNLKLASFLIPKNEAIKQQATITNGVVLKPVVVASNSNVVHTNTTPQLDINRKIVKIKDIPKTFHNAKILPKIKPKESPANTPRHTSVQLLKLGETYHSLNTLSNDQMKIVNHALKIFNNPRNPRKAQEPSFDPVANTRFIYKVVSPKNLAVVSNKNKVIFKQKKNDIKKEPVKKIERKEINLMEDEHEEEMSAIAETKVTRSGRKVKLPKNIVHEETPQKPRKKSGTIVSCFQCSTEFSSLYRLQRHYENHPTHIPAKIHSNLFHCLLAIIKGGSEEDGANIFVQQLEQLIAKIKSLLPCLLTRPKGLEGKQSTISDDVGRLFGMKPGKYSLNMDALSCVRNKDGHCRHNPQPTPLQSNITLEQNTSDNEIKETVDTDDCARINSAEKWPTVSKRMEGRKIKSEPILKQEDSNAKKMKMTNDPESDGDIGMDDIVAFLTSSDKLKTEVNTPLIQSPEAHIDEHSCDVQVITESDNNPKDKNSRPPHIQFHSAHFDIRSSPIKSSSTVFRKFKIDPDKIARYEPQIIQPPALKEDSNASFSLPPQDISQENSSSLRPEIFNEEISLPCKGPEELTFDAKHWTITDQPDYLKTSTLIEESSDSYNIKPSSLIEPALLHIKDTNNKTAQSEPNHNHEVNDLRLMPNTSQSVLTFLDSLGNSVDFQLDLFP